MSSPAAPQRFRQKFGPLCLFGLVLGQALNAVLTAALWAVDSDWFLPAADYFPLGALSATLITVSLAAWSVYTARIEVGPAGLRWTSARGSTEPVIPWDSIHTAGVRSYLGIPHVRFVTDIGREYWYPLSLADAVGFVEGVAGSAGEDHPLARELRRWVEDD
jgi:hypothetical protein